jgi:DNA polymerase III delta prime subunit
MPVVLIQGPPGTGKTLTLAMVAIGYPVVRRQKVVVATPSNNAANEFAEKIIGMWVQGSDPAKRQVSRPPNLVRWLTPATDQLIMNNVRAWGIPESMAEISMAKKIQERVRRAVCEGTDLEKTVARE